MKTLLKHLMAIFGRTPRSPSPRPSPPRRGRRGCACGCAKTLVSFPRGECCSLSPGERVGVRASQISSVTKAGAIIAVALTLVAANAFASTPAPTKSTATKSAAPTALAVQPSTLAPTAPLAISPAHPRTHFAPSHFPTSPAVVEADIRDIRSPRHLPTPWLWVAYSVGALILAIAAFAAWRWYQRGKFTAKLPYEIALDRLEEARRFMTPEQAHAFCTEVSEVIRGYIEFRFNVRAAHRTTEEFLHDLLEEKQDKLAAHRTSLAEFLQHCDLAKFALWQFSVPEMEAMHGSARAFVLQSAIDAVVKKDAAKADALPKSPRVHLDPSAPTQIHVTPKPA